jgi:lipoprotein-anchoring transpeptidase ErfK/SrfK
MAGSDPSPRTDLRQHRRLGRLRITIGALLLLIVVGAGGIFLLTRGDATEQAAPRRTTSTTEAVAGPFVSTSLGVAPLRAATTKDANLAVYATPDANAQPMTTLSAQTEYLLPRTVLAFDQYQDWLHVYLPTRPNDGTAWVKSADVMVSKALDDQIKISLADHKLTLLHNGSLVFEAPAAIGTDENPTPTGTFYYTDPLDLSADPGTAYGVFAIGLSGHSNTLSEFAGGDGQIAIHGTNDPGTIGQNVSHGCVRVYNDVILKLAKLPLGTPVIIS